jgi:AcrR family transcriptional regulator
LRDGVRRSARAAKAAAIPKGTATPASRRRARLPSRERGQVRFQSLLRATEALLLEQSPDDIGLYQIARRAHVAPASVYHFFPTKNAALLALAENYHKEIRTLVNAPVPAARLLSWQDLIIVRQARAVDYYNQNVAAAKIFLGIHPNWEVHQADQAYNKAASESLFGCFDRLFQMPYVQEPQARFEVIYAIADAIWGISFERHGRIVARYAEEAVTACIAYCRTFLPDRTPARPEVAAAAARGDLMALRWDSGT